MGSLLRSIGERVLAIIVAIGAIGAFIFAALFMSRRKREQAIVSEAEAQFNMKRIDELEARADADELEEAVLDEVRPALRRRPRAPVVVLLLVLATSGMFAAPNECQPRPLGCACLTIAEMADVKRELILRNAEIATLRAKVPPPITFYWQIGTNYTFSDETYAGWADIGIGIKGFSVQGGILSTEYGTGPHVAATYTRRF